LLDLDFVDILVKECKLRWNTKNNPNVLKSSLEIMEVNGYYVYTSSLKETEYINIHLIYNKENFGALDKKMQYTSEFRTPLRRLMIFLIILFSIILVVGIITISYLKRDKYQNERGFIIYHRTYPLFYNRYHTSGVKKDGKPINPPSSSGGGCACSST